MTDQPRRIGGTSEDGFDDGSVKNPSVLDELRTALKEEVHKDPITLPVKTRANVTVRYDINIDGEMMQLWQRNCTDKKQNFDMMRFAKIVLSHTCEEILMRDQETGLKFTSRELQDMVGATTPQSAIEKFFGDDAILIATARAVVDAAGYGEDIEELLDPTQNS